MSKAVVSIIVILLIVVASAAVLNYFYQPGAGTPNLPQALQPQKSIPVAKALYSGAVSMYMNGKISSISGDKITVVDGNDSVAISIKENTPISRIVQPGTKQTDAGPLKMADLKTGDMVYINFKLLSDNSLQAISMTVTDPAK